MSSINKILNKIHIKGFENMKGQMFYYSSSKIIECVDAINKDDAVSYYQLYFNMSGHDDLIDVTLHTSEGKPVITSWKNGNQKCEKIKKSDLKTKKTFMKAIADMLIKQGF